MIKAYKVSDRNKDGFGRSDRSKRMRQIQNILSGPKISKNTRIKNNFIVVNINFGKIYLRGNRCVDHAYYTYKYKK